MSVYSVSPVLMNGFSMVTATPGVNDPEVGTVARSGDEEFIFVYNDGASDISKGYGATLSGVTGYSVTVSSTTSVDIAIGVCVHATLTTGTYGWLMKKGFCNFKATPDSVVSAGARLILGDNGVWGQASTASNVSNTGNGIYGKCVAATGSAGTGVGYFSIY
jgi:hypothetical protein